MLQYPVRKSRKRMKTYCPVCGGHGDLEVHHKVNAVRARPNGPFRESDMVLLCPSCHAGAHHKARASAHLYEINGQLCDGKLVGGLALPGFVRKAVDKVKDRFVVRNDLPPQVRAALYNIGHLPVSRLQACRIPVASAIAWALNLISLGSFFRNMARQGYDKMFHLFLLFKLEDGSSWRFERNEVISLAPFNEQPQDAMDVFIAGRQLTMQGMWDKALEQKGPEIYKYDPIKCNCQDFVATLIGANGLMTPDLHAYVVQDASHLLPTYAQKFGRWTTDLAAKFNHLIFGAGRNSYYANRGVVPFYGGRRMKGGSGPLGDHYTIGEALEQLESLQGNHSEDAMDMTIEILEALFADYHTDNNEWKQDVASQGYNSAELDANLDAIIKALLVKQDVFKYGEDTFTQIDPEEAKRIASKYGSNWSSVVHLRIPAYLWSCAGFKWHRPDVTDSDLMTDDQAELQVADVRSFPGWWLFMTVKGAEHTISKETAELQSEKRDFKAEVERGRFVPKPVIRGWNRALVTVKLLAEFVRYSRELMGPALEAVKASEVADEKDEKEGKEGKDEKGAGWRKRWLWRGGSTEPPPPQSHMDTKDGSFVYPYDFPELDEDDPTDYPPGEWIGHPDEDPVGNSYGSFVGPLPDPGSTSQPPPEEKKGSGRFRHRRGGAYNPAAPPITRASQDAKVAEAKQALLDHAADFQRMTEAMLSGDRDTAMKVAGELVGHLAPYPGMGAMVPFLTGVADLLSRHSDPMAADYHKNIRAYIDQAFDAVPFIGPAIEKALLPAAEDKFNAPADSYTGQLYKDPNAYKKFDGYKAMGYNPYYYAAQHGARDDYWNITNPDEMRAYNATHGTNYVVYGGKKKVRFRVPA